MHVKFFQYLCLKYIYQQKKKTHLTQLTKNRSQVPFKKYTCSKGEKFKGTNQKNLSILGTMYFEMMQL